MKLYFPALLALALLQITGCQSSSDDSPAAQVGNVDGPRSGDAVAADPGDAGFVERGGAIDSDVIEERMLAMVNAARASAQNCGDVLYPAAPALAWSERAEAAARAHAVDMARAERFTHTGSDGSNVGDRLTMQNYRWTRAAENLAFGYGTPEGAFQGWMASSGHCENIMSTLATEIGVSSADSSSGADSGRYWVMVLATPSGR